MERVKIMVILLAAMMASEVYGGTVLVMPPPPKDLNSKAESYPESRFGYGPAQPIQLDARRALIVRENEFGEEQQSQALGGRGPASVDANTDSGGQSMQRRSSSVLSRNEKDPRDADAEISKNLVSKRNGVQEVAVIASDLGFFPKTLFVNRDVPVRLFVTGTSKATLCMMMDSFNVHKQVRSQKIEEIAFLPNLAGKFRFYCPVNGAEGTLVVRELGDAVQSIEKTAETVLPPLPRVEPAMKKAERE